VKEFQALKIPYPNDPEQFKKTLEEKQNNI
jgi:hypothetical protein